LLASASLRAQVSKCQTCKPHIVENIGLQATQHDILTCAFVHRMKEPCDDESTEHMGNLLVEDLVASSSYLLTNNMLSLVQHDPSLSHAVVRIDSTALTGQCNALLVARDLCEQLYNPDGALTSSDRHVTCHCVHMSYFAASQPMMWPCLDLPKARISVAATAPDMQWELRYPALRTMDSSM
jgi:hypothetical protein